MKKRYYIVDKDNVEMMHGYIDIDKIKGFDFKPQNNVKYEGIEVGHLTVASPELIKSILIRKTKRKINTYLNYLLTSVDDEDDDEALTLFIDDIQRFKALIVNKYSKFLDKAYISSLLKKVRFVEKQLISKLNRLSYEENVIGRRR